MNFSDSIGIQWFFYKDVDICEHFQSTKCSLTKIIKFHPQEPVNLENPWKSVHINLYFYFVNLNYHQDSAGTYFDLCISLLNMEWLNYPSIGHASWNQAII